MAREGADVRVLLIEDDEVDALAIRRALGDRHEIRTAATLAAAVRLLRGPGWRPEVVIADLNLPDSEGPATIEALQDAAEATPVIVSTGLVTETLRRHVDALGAVRLHDKHDGYALLRAVVHQQETIQRSVAAARAELLAEIDKVARRAADAAVAQTMPRLLHRLGLEDEEGVRMAVRLARAWETAKVRFVGTIAAGIASAVLLALAAGIAALVKGGTR
jgi:DNA-binding NarL/FixJ family response regulator